MVTSRVIQNCLERDSKGHKELYNSCAPYVFSITRRYIENVEDCKDVMQEVFASVFIKIEQFNPAKGEFKFWLRKITINTCLKHRRKHKAYLTVESNEKLQPPDESYLNSVQLSREDIAELLERMPERYRLVFMLSIMDDYSHKEIAAQLNISAETSRSQLTRAKKWLRKYLQDSKKWEQYGLL